MWMWTGGGWQRRKAVLVLILPDARLLLDAITGSAVDVAWLLRLDSRRPSSGAASSNIDGVLTPDSNDFVEVGLEVKALAI